MKDIQIAAIGKERTIMVFKVAGIHTIKAEESKEVKIAIESLARNGCRLIFITEEAACLAQESLDKYRFKPFPIILPISNNSKDDNISMKKIYDNIEKALGTRRINNL